MKPLTASGPHGKAGVLRSPLAAFDSNRTFGRANASRSRSIGPSSSSKVAPAAPKAAASPSACEGSPSPQEVEIPGQLDRAVHNPCNLANDDHLVARAVQSAQQRERIEAARAVGGDGPDVIVRLVMLNPRAGPPVGHQPNPTNRHAQACHRIVAHLGIEHDRGTLGIGRPGDRRGWLT